VTRFEATIVDPSDYFTGWVITVDEKQFTGL
jgi:hypothetical protein